MIDQLRLDLQGRLDQLLAEADKLRRALAALTHGSSNGEASAVDMSGAAPKSASRQRTRAVAKASTQPKAAVAVVEPPARAESGATRNAVLGALASGNAMTAGEVAAATGLGRASVSTTLSKLAKAGTIRKAERGYQIGEQAATDS